MLRFRYIFALVLPLPGGACEKPAEVRYRVTVEVRAGDEIVSGSSVMAFRLKRSWAVMPYDAEFEGEAISVDIPGHGTLFALLGGMSPVARPEQNTLSMLPERQFGDFGRAMRRQPTLGGDRVDDIRRISKQIGATVQLDCTLPPLYNDCPMLVRFRDISDPKTIEMVEWGNMAKTFGPGFGLERITVQITDAPVSTGIKRRLPWLSGYPEPSLDPSHGLYDRSLPAIVHHGDFERHPK